MYIYFVVGIMSAISTSDHYNYNNNYYYDNVMARESMAPDKSFDARPKRSFRRGGTSVGVSRSSMS